MFTVYELMEDDSFSASLEGIGWTMRNEIMLNKRLVE